MDKDEQVIAFNHEVDRLLGIEPGGPAGGPGELSDVTAEAARLIAADFGAEAQPRPGLRARWKAESRAWAVKAQPAHRVLRLRWAWALGALAVLFSALFVFRQPVLATVGRLFGYGYFPQAGFLQLEGGWVLSSPVQQEHEGRSLTVTLGVATPEHTLLWLEDSEPARPGERAWLETPSGKPIQLTSWSWAPDQPGSHGLRLEFPPLPPETSLVTLALPEGWRIPLEWIPADQAGLPSTDISAPYPASTPGETVLPAATAEPQPVAATEPPCVAPRGLQVCLKAAQTDAGGTRVLLVASVTDSQLNLETGYTTFPFPDPLTGDLDVSLTDDLGNTASQPADQIEPAERQAGVLQQAIGFPPADPQSRQLTLRIPAFEASAVFPEPLELSVDLGPDPQPGQTLAVDQTLDILGQPLHFSQATLQGDGINSLEVRLVSDPAEPKDGLLVAGLDLGKPEGIDDRYGSGGVSPQGQVHVFTELIGPVSGKKTGLLTFPISGARVLLLGPFEFTFPAPAPEPASATPEPRLVGGDSFSPQPTPAPLALDSYRYTGRTIQAGELLFTVVGAETTELYAANLQSGAAPEPVATLPGQVYQVYLHPDRNGVDYLAGTQESDPGGGLTFYRAAQVFTLRFGDPQPRLLAAFPPGPENVLGTELTAGWSYDGRFMVFQLSNYYPKQGEPSFKIGWIDLACRESEACDPQFLETPTALHLNGPVFSPDTYQVLISGTDEANGAHMPDIYLFDLNAEGQASPLANLTSSDQAAEMFPNWLPEGGRFVTSCWDPTIPMNEYDLCQFDAPGAGEHLLRLPGNMHQITLSPDGKRLADYAYIDGREQVRVFDRESGRTALIAGDGNWPFLGFAFSPDGGSLALLKAKPTIDESNVKGGAEPATQVSLYALPDGPEILLFDAGEAGEVSWLGWAR